jgi:hypothetical protein
LKRHVGRIALGDLDALVLGVLLRRHGLELVGFVRVIRNVAEELNGLGLLALDRVGETSSSLTWDEYAWWARTGIARFSVESSGSRVVHSRTPSFV